MSSRRRTVLIVLAIVGALLLACVAAGVVGVVLYVMSGNFDFLPYPDGPPPTPSVKP